MTVEVSRYFESYVGLWTLERGAHLERREVLAVIGPCGSVDAHSTAQQLLGLPLTEEEFIGRGIWGWLPFGFTLRHPGSIA